MPRLFNTIATELFSKIDSRAMFIVVHEYENNFGEVSTYSLCWHINYLNAVIKSLSIMNSYKPNRRDCKEKPFTLNDLKIAHKEWIESLNDTIKLGPGNNPRYTNVDVYDTVTDSKGIKIPGLKVHKKEDALHLTDVYRLNKIVIVPGHYPSYRSANKTLAKKFLRSKTPLVNWGQFKLQPGRFKSITVQNLTVNELDVIRRRGDIK